MIMAAVIALALAGCNDDVFIESFEPDGYVYVLQGDGDRCTINFASTDWNYLWVKVVRPTDNAIYFFDVRDHRGNVLTQGETMSARLEGRGYIHVTGPSLSVYFMRDKLDRVIVHTEQAPLQPVDFELSAHSSAGQMHTIDVAIKN